MKEPIELTGDGDEIVIESGKYIIRGKFYLIAVKPEEPYHDDAVETKLDVYSLVIKEK